MPRRENRSSIPHAALPAMVLAILWAPAQAAECPETLVGRPLTGGSVFDGHPSQLASQVPYTRGRWTGWDVGPNFYVECHYRGTQQTHAVRLRPGLRRCTTVRSGTNPPAQNIACE